MGKLINQENKEKDKVIVEMEAVKSPDQQRDRLIAYMNRLQKQ